MGFNSSATTGTATFTALKLQSWKYGTGPCLSHIFCRHGWSLMWWKRTSSGFNSLSLVNCALNSRAPVAVCNRLSGLFSRQTQARLVTGTTRGTTRKRPLLRYDRDLTDLTVAAVTPLSIAATFGSLASEIPASAPTICVLP